MAAADIADPSHPGAGRLFEMVARVGLLGPALVAVAVLVMPGPARAAGHEDGGGVIRIGPAGHDTSPADVERRLLALRGSGGWHSPRGDRGGGGRRCGRPWHTGCWGHGHRRGGHQSGWRARGGCGSRHTSCGGGRGRHTPGAGSSAGDQVGSAGLAEGRAGGVGGPAGGAGQRLGRRTHTRLQGRISLASSISRMRSKGFSVASASARSAASSPERAPSAVTA